MKTKLLGVVSLMLAAMVAGSGCGHLDTTPLASADRVLTGVVTTSNGGGELPADAELTIRVVDLARGEGRGETLAEETIKNPGAMPVSFRIEYRAEDLTLMRSVNVEARIAVGRRLRYATTSGHPITLGNVNDPHTVLVEFANR